MWKISLDEAGVRNPDKYRIVVSEQESHSPFILPGFRRHTLILPRKFEDQFDREIIRHVFRHEASHLLAGDAHWIPATKLLCCLGWVHPLLWWVAALHLRSCEEAADATAARLGGERQYRGALAELALNLLPVKNGAIPSFLRLPSVLDRLRSVERNTRLRRPTRLPALVVIIMMLGFGAVIGNVGLAQKKGSPGGTPVEKNAAESAPPKTPRPEWGQKEMKLVKKADDLALRGMQLLIASAWEDAFENYREAVAILPRHEMTQNRLEFYLKDLIISATNLSQQFEDNDEHQKGENLRQLMLSYQRDEASINEKKRERQTTSVVSKAKPNFEEDASSHWYRAFLLNHTATDFETRGDYLKALDKLKEAEQGYLRLKELYPDFQPQIVAYKLRAMADRRSRLQAKLKNSPPANVPLMRQRRPPGPPLKPNVLTPNQRLFKEEELIESVLKIRGVTSNWDPDQSQGSRLALEVEIESDHGNVPGKISEKDMTLRVWFYDRVEKNKLAPTLSIKQRAPSAPIDWKNGETEMIEMDYFLPKEKAVRENRKYYGYVVELYHRDILQSVVASPSKLLRLVRK